MADDYYERLQVPHSASPDEIQKAYRKLARKFHPDLHADKSDKEKALAKQKFQEIQQAYDVLNDPEKREMYDRFGPGFESGGGPRGGQPFEGGAPFGNMDIDFSQIFGGPQGPGAGPQRNAPGGFENIFRHFGGAGAGAPTAAPTQGRDVSQDITVSFHTAVVGGEHQVSLQRRNGKVDTIAIKIPAGIENGKKIRLRGQGEVGAPGGPRGDLLVNVRVATHPNYTRKGLNLNVTVPITFKEAIFGTRIDLPTPHGLVTVTVPERTNNGKSLRLKGMGIKSKEASGDLMVRLEIRIPDDISAADADMLGNLSDDWNDKKIRDELKW